MNADLERRQNELTGKLEVLPDGHGNVSLVNYAGVVVTTMPCAVALQLAGNLVDAWQAHRVNVNADYKEERKSL